MDWEVSQILKSKKLDKLNIAYFASALLIVSNESSVINKLPEN